MITTTIRSSSLLFRKEFCRKRWFSVVNLSDEKAVQTFSTDNQKSILYFTATWCGPCRMIKPIYEKMAEQHKDIAFGKVDVDDNQESALDFQISAVPTFVLFNGGESIQRFSGADPSKLEELVQDLAAR